MKHLQILDFEPLCASAKVRTLDETPFSCYTWLIRHPKRGDILYGLRAASNEGILTRFRLPDEETSTVEIIESVSTGGVDPCHGAITPDGDLIAIANVRRSRESSNYRPENPSECYSNDSSSVTTFGLELDGHINQASLTIYDFTALNASFRLGPNPDRQDAPHPHGCFYIDSFEGLYSARTWVAISSGYCGRKSLCLVYQVLDLGMPLYIRAVCTPS